MSDTTQPAPQGHSVLAFLTGEFGAQELPTLSYLAAMLTQEENEVDKTAPASVQADTSAAATSTQQPEEPALHAAAAAAEEAEEADTVHAVASVQVDASPAEAAAAPKNDVPPPLPGISMLDFVIRNLCQDRHEFPCLHMLRDQLQHDNNHNNNSKEEEEGEHKTKGRREESGSHAVTLSTEADKDLTEDMIMIGDEGGSSSRAKVRHEPPVKVEEEQPHKKTEKDTNDNDNEDDVAAALASEMATSPSSVQYTEGDKAEDEKRVGVQQKQQQQQRQERLHVLRNGTAAVGTAAVPHETALPAEGKAKTSEAEAAARHETHVNHNNKPKERHHEGNDRWQAGRRPRRISEALLTQLREQLHARRTPKKVGALHAQHEQRPNEDASEVVAQVRRSFVERYLDNLYGRKHSNGNNNDNGKPSVRASPYSRLFHGNTNPLPHEDKTAKEFAEEKQAQHLPSLPEAELEPKARTPPPLAEEEKKEEEGKAQVMSSRAATPHQLAQRHITSEFFRDYRVPVLTPRTPSRPQSGHETGRLPRLSRVPLTPKQTPAGRLYSSRRNSHSIRLHNDGEHLPPTGAAVPAVGLTPVSAQQAGQTPLVKRRRSSANGRQQGRPPCALVQPQPPATQNSLDLVVVGKTMRMVQSQPRRPSSAMRQK